MTERLSGRPTILSVDDDEPLARCLRERLAGAGYFVQRAASGREALVELEAADARLIVLSLLLPDTDGLILCASIKARTSTPVVVVSDRLRDVDRALALELGALDVVTRPCEIDSVMAKIPDVVRAR